MSNISKVNSFADGYNISEKYVREQCSQHTHTENDATQTH